MGDSNALDHLVTILKAPEGVTKFVSQPALWEEIKRLADVHRFTGQLAYLTSHWLPTSERSWRDRTLMTHHRRHAERLAGLRRLVEVFSEEGIACVSLKGPLFAERFYEQPFLRPANDIDLLVKESEIGRAARVMMKLGFELPGSYSWRLHRTVDKHLDFSPTGQLPRVELHYRLQGGGTFLSAEGFIERSRKSGAAGFSASVLSPPDEFFYTCMHAANHAFHRLRWVYDTIRVAQRLTTAERDAVRGLAIRHSQTGQMTAAIFVARDFFSESLPLDITGFHVPWLWSKLSSRHIRRMVSRVEGNTASLLEKIGYRLDLCRMAGSPWKAAKLISAGIGIEFRKGCYGLLNPLEPGTLARTLPD
jgi:hypothetical protein